MGSKFMALLAVYGYNIRIWSVYFCNVCHKCFVKYSLYGFTPQW
jgi:hypothetical protein